MFSSHPHQHLLIDKEVSLICCLPMVDWPSWPAVTGLEGGGVMYELSNSYLQAWLAPQNFGCAWCYVLIQHLFISTGVWGRKPWALNVNHFVVGCYGYTSFRSFLLCELCEIRKIFPRTEVVSPSCGCFSTVILYDLIWFSKWLFILCMKSFCVPLGFVWYEGS